MAPVSVAGEEVGEKRYVERHRPFQKLDGEYLFETRRTAMLEPESDAPAPAGGASSGLDMLVGYTP